MPPGNARRASEPTSKPCCIQPSSTSSASSGWCTSRYNRLLHCTPAMNFDLLILQVGFTGTGVFIAASSAADSSAISSFFVFGTLKPHDQTSVRSWTLRRFESLGEEKRDQY